VSEYKQVDCNDKVKLSLKLAEILDAVNFLHPFREGNGRTQRDFVRSLALEMGWTLWLNRNDSADVYEKYMAGTVNGDIKLLSELFSENLIKSRPVKTDSRAPGMAKREQMAGPVLKGGGSSSGPRMA
jgi:cell filamentation protein